MLEHLKDLYEYEYIFVKNYFFQSNHFHRYYGDPKEVVNNAIQKMLGAAELVQLTDSKISYDELATLFNEYKEKIKNLL